MMALPESTLSHIKKRGGLEITITHEKDGCLYLKLGPERIDLMLTWELLKVEDERDAKFLADFVIDYYERKTGKLVAHPPIQ